MKAEFDALRAAAKETAGFATKVETVVKVNADGSPVRGNYVVLSPSVPDLDDERYTAPQRADSTRRCRTDVRFVAVDTDGLLAMVEAIHGSLIGRTLVVSGRTCTRIRLLPGVEEGRVRFDATSRLVYLDETLEFWSRRA